MATKTSRNPVTTDKTEEVTEVENIDVSSEQNKGRKSEILCSIEEFLISKSLRPEYAEGFKAFMGATRFQGSEDWEKSLELFRNRKVQ